MYCWPFAPHLIDIPLSFANCDFSRCLILFSSSAFSALLFLVHLFCIPCYHLPHCRTLPGFVEQQARDIGGCYVSQCVCALRFPSLYAAGSPRAPRAIGGLCGCLCTNIRHVLFVSSHMGNRQFIYNEHAAPFCTPHGKTKPHCVLGELLQTSPHSPAQHYPRSSRREMNACMSVRGF
jgi:hypothetical protein